MTGQISALNVSNRRMVFGVPGEPIADKLHHYTECGLDDVWLSSGFHVREFDGEEYVAVNGVEALHLMIALRLAVRRGPLAGDEIRFLRKHLELTQEQLADQLDLTRKSINAFETGKDKMKPDTGTHLQLKVAAAIQKAISARVDANPNQKELKALHRQNEIILEWISELISLPIKSDPNEDIEAMPAYIAQAKIDGWQMTLNA